MRTRRQGAATGAATFTQRKRRDQLVECAIEAIVEVGYPRASVAEVARRAGVSKGVVTYHFRAKDDLIQAVIDDVVAEMRQYMEPLLRAANPMQYPERFIAPYLTAWTGYIRTHGRDVLALVRIFDAYPHESGRLNPTFDARAEEITLVAGILRRGQEGGYLRVFDPYIMARVMKAALDDLLRHYAANPELDLEASGTELVAMFEAATRPDRGSATKPLAAGQRATTPHPVQLATLKEEK
jgi:TetR/AcrR family transcriptional regulator, fatty acid metabolism regulator protein